MGKEPLHITPQPLHWTHIQNLAHSRTRLISFWGPKSLATQEWSTNRTSTLPHTWRCPPQACCLPGGGMPPPLSSRIAPAWNEQSGGTQKRSVHGMNSDQDHSLTGGEIAAVTYRRYSGIGVAKLVQSLDCCFTMVTGLTNCSYKITITHNKCSTIHEHNLLRSIVQVFCNCESMCLKQLGSADSSQNFPTVGVSLHNLNPGHRSSNLQPMVHNSYTGAWQQFMLHLWHHHHVLATITQQVSLLYTVL